MILKYIKYRVDSISGLFSLFLFLFLFLYIIQIDKSMQKYHQYQNSIHQMKLLNKTFDTFLLRRYTFINYDKINESMHRFEENTALLDTKEAQEKFDRKYTAILSEIKESSQKKFDFIETFKTNNASLINSIYYLFDLNKKIRNTHTIKRETTILTSDILMFLGKSLINPYIDNKPLIQNIQRLKASLHQNSHIELKLFATHLSNNMIRIKKLSEIQKENEKLALSQQIEQLSFYLKNNYTNHILIQKVLAITLFLSTFIILMLLFILYLRSLKTKNELYGFKSAVENSDNSIVITDANQNITYVNRNFEKETGYKREDVIGQNPRILKSGKMPQDYYDELNKKLRKGEVWKGEFINRRKDKSIFYEKASIVPIFLKGKLVNYLAIKLNITEYIEKKREIEFLAYHDALTLLPNRSKIKKHIQQKLVVAKYNHAKTAILFIDMDRFKIINDTLGHDVGDEILIASANRIKDSLGESDMLARIGGDEFIIVLDSIHTKNDVT